MQQGAIVEKRSGMGELGEVEVPCCTSWYQNSIGCGDGQVFVLTLPLKQDKLSLI